MYQPAAICWFSLTVHFILYNSYNLHIWPYIPHIWLNSKGALHFFPVRQRMANVLYIKVWVKWNKNLDRIGANKGMPIKSRMNHEFALQIKNQMESCSIDPYKYTNKKVLSQMATSFETMFTFLFAAEWFQFAVHRNQWHFYRKFRLQNDECFSSKKKKKTNE